MYQMYIRNKTIMILKRLILALLCTTTNMMVVRASVCGTLCPMSIKNSACDFICGNNEIEEHIQSIHQDYSRVTEELQMYKKLLRYEPPTPNHQEEKYDDTAADREQEIQLLKDKLYACEHAAVVQPNPTVFNHDAAANFSYLFDDEPPPIVANTSSMFRLVIKLAIVLVLVIK